MILDKQENKLYKPKNSKDYINKIKSFTELKKEVEEILNLFYIYLTEYFEREENQLKKELEKLNEKEVEKEKIKAKPNNLKHNNNNKNNKIRKNLKPILLKRNKTAQDIRKVKENKKKELENKRRKEIEAKKSEFNELIDKLKTSLDNLQNKLIFYEVINKESILNNDKEISFNLEYDLFYTKPTFEEKNEDKIFFPIRGGCFPQINNKIYLSENQEMNERIYDNLVKNKDIKMLNKNNKKYFVIKTELRSGYIFGNSLYYLTKPIDSNKILIEMALLTENNNNNYSQKSNNLKDMSGNSLAFYKIALNPFLDNNIPKREELQKKNNFGERAELYAITIEDSDYLQKLVSLPYSDFSCSTEGGLTPLASALINDSRNMTNILLNKKYISKNGDLNFSNELGLTLLHLAVMSKNDYAILKLIENGADISRSNRKEANTPIHLMGINSRNEIISNIYQNKNFVILYKY